MVVSGPVGLGHRKSGPYPLLGAAASSSPRSSRAMTGWTSRSHGRYQPWRPGFLSTSSADIVSCSGEIANRHRAASPRPNLSTSVISRKRYTRIRPAPNLGGTRPLSRTLVVMAEPAPAPAAPVSKTRLLSGNPAFRSLCASRAVSFVGDGITTTALVLLVAPRDGPTGVGLLLFANALPRLGGPLAGVLADRVQTRRLMMRCELASALVLGLTAITLPPLPVLTALVAVAGILATIRNPAGRSLVPVLVDAADRAPANALFGLGRTLTLAVGPGLGGLLGAAPGGAHTALAVD